MDYQDLPDLLRHSPTIIVFPSEVYCKEANLHEHLISHPSASQLLRPNLLLVHLLLVHHDSILLPVADTCYLIDNAIRISTKDNFNKHLTTWEY